ncbi:response regulator transcription factor [Streptomyces sp. R302]|nr:response regulator transcription factor [Streptomyces sp. R301]NML79911.1 response regulator transcription factor [Streptomyces sp. R302]
MYSKIGATHRTQAALYARDTGLSDPGAATRPAPASTLVLEREAPSVGPALTAREEGVLRLLSEGLSNRLISRNLGISEKTVKNHLNSIYSKIGATHRTQAALYALHSGL